MPRGTGKGGDPSSSSSSSWVSQAVRSVASAGKSAIVNSTVGGGGASGSGAGVGAAGSGGGSSTPNASSSAHAKIKKLKRNQQAQVNRQSAQFYTGVPDGDTNNNSVVYGGASSDASNRRVSTARDPSILVQVQVEYWHQNKGRWGEGAQLRAKKSKAYLEVFDNKENATAGAGGASSKGDPPKCFEFELDSSLRVEHSTPLSRDFHLVIAGSGGKHRVAVYSEGEGQDLIRVLRQQGAQVIKRKALPPCLPPPRPPPAKAKRPLRPISEGEILNSLREEEADDGAMIGDGGVSRAALLRSKSTGSSDPDLSGMRRKKAGSAASPASGSGADLRRLLLPRSSSLRGDEEEQGRGLSTGSTSRKAKKKQRSDQSLNSDEVSSGSGCFHNDDEEAERDADSDSSLATVSSADDPDGIFTDLAAKTKRPRRRLRSKNSSGGEDANSVSPRPSSSDFRRRQDEHGSKLDRYRFLLVNLEDDPDVMDPADFGVDGSYRSADFDDYPAEVFDGAAAATDVPDSPAAATPSSSSSRGGTPKWIRKSFEELDLDVSITEHGARRRNSHSSNVNKASSTLPPNQQPPHPYLRQTSSLSAASMTDLRPRPPSLETSSREVRKRLEGADVEEKARASRTSSSSSTPPPPLPSRNRPLRQISKISKGSSSKSSSSKKKEGSSSSPSKKEKKRPVMLFGDGEEGTEV